MQTYDIVCMFYKVHCYKQGFDWFLSPIYMLIWCVRIICPYDLFHNAWTSITDFRCLWGEFYWHQWHNNFARIPIKTSTKFLLCLHDHSSSWKGLCGVPDLYRSTISRLRHCLWRAQSFRISITKVTLCLIDICDTFCVTFMFWQRAFNYIIKTYNNNSIHFKKGNDVGFQNCNYIIFNSNCCRCGCTLVR